MAEVVKAEVTLVAVVEAVLEVAAQTVPIMAELVVVV